MARPSCRRAPRRGVLLMPGRLTLCVLSLRAGALLVLAICILLSLAGDKNLRPDCYNSYWCGSLLPLHLVAICDYRINVAILLRPMDSDVL